MLVIQTNHSMLSTYPKKATLRNRNAFTPFFEGLVLFAQSLVKGYTSVI